MNTSLLSQRKSYAALLFLFVFSYRICCQNTSDIGEQTKMLIFTSIYSDASTASFITWDKWVSISKNHYDYLKVESTSIHEFFLSSSMDAIKSSYNLQLYKVKDENSRNKSRYLLKYKDFYNHVWLRVGGYSENDLNLLFDYLQKRGVKKKKLKKLLEEWEIRDDMFKEVGLSCLLNGYYKKSTKSECYIAVSYIKLLDTSIGFDPLDKNNINAKFSRVPLYGYFKKYAE